MHTLTRHERLTSHGSGSPRVSRPAFADRSLSWIVKQEYFSFATYKLGVGSALRMKWHKLFGNTCGTRTACWPDTWIRRQACSWFPVFQRPSYSYVQVGTYVKKVCRGAVSNDQCRLDGRSHAHLSRICLTAPQVYLCFAFATCWWRIDITGWLVRNDVKSWSEESQSWQLGGGEITYKVCYELQAPWR